MKNEETLALAQNIIDETGEQRRECERKGKGVPFSDRFIELNSAEIETLARAYVDMVDWRLADEQTPLNWPVDVWGPPMSGPMIGVLQANYDGSKSWMILDAGLETGNQPWWEVPLFEITHWLPRPSAPDIMPDSSQEG